MTKRLVELMSGSMSVESSCGRASVFCVELTRMQAAPLQLATAELPNASVVTVIGEAAQVYTMLYVEDNVANLMLVEDVMTSVV